MIESLRSIFEPLFELMGSTLTTFHDWGAPWWLSIVMLTVVVRTLLLPLTVRQVKSMRKMQDLKPELDEIRTKYKDDRQKQQEEQMKLYGERKVNPLGSCLPLFIQLPIFLVLYYTIKQFEHLESFRTGGLFWFQDLTVADPYFILPVAYVLTMMASQELTIRRTNPQQKQLMRFMPLIFGSFLAFGGFPSGLFVYWVTSNTITFSQNLIVYGRPSKPVPKEETGNLKEAPEYGNRPTNKTVATASDSPSEAPALGARSNGAARKSNAAKRNRRKKAKKRR
jgi:YidC/Oxa1 family membrane protein insertase